MDSNPTRRSVLKGAGALIGGVALGTQTVSASKMEDRYVLDMRESPDRILEDVEVVHRLEAIDAAVVRADRSDLRHAQYTPDFEFQIERPEAAYSDEVVGVDGYSEPYYYLQWDKADQRVPDAHDYTRGEGTRVAVIDSGVWSDHPDLEHAVNEELSRNMTNDGGDHKPNGTGDHGTHVAGIIAADDRNDEGALGTAPATEIVDLRVFGAGGGSSFGDVIAAMVYSVQADCDVANLSLGAYPLPIDNPFVGILKALMERAAQLGEERGTLMIAAAGNDGTNLDTDGDVISLPNEADGIMSVSSTGPVGFRWDDDWNGGYFEDERRDMDDALYHVWRTPDTAAPYTNYGADAIDIAGPGGNFDQQVVNSNWENWYYDLVLSTVFAGDGEDKSAGYGWKAGTSMAAPNVAGAAALVKSQYPDATPIEVRQHLYDTARDGPEKYVGNGYLDVEAAVQTLL